MASVKWVRRIEVVTTPFAGYFQRDRYVYESAGVVSPVSRMRVKSLIVAPADGETVAPGKMSVWGWAWSGDGAIVRVELSLGGEWHEATLAPSESPHAWTRWSCVLPAAVPGRYVVRSRATDAAGNVQPDEAPWNSLGYGNNAIQSRTVVVATA
jgi:hypothetical protein